jgi:hypothetical protein
MFAIDKAKPVEKVNISKRLIEEKLSQKDLWRYYLSGFDVDAWLNTRQNFKSELRTDNKPTCSLYSKGQNIYYKDWAGHFQGDIYNLVCYLNNLSYGDLMGAMKIIVRDFAHVFYGANERQNEYIKSLAVELKEEENRFRQIQIKKMIWTVELVKYWNGYEIAPLSFLADHDVFCPQYVWIDGKLRYTYSKHDPAIAYFFGNGRYKIYFPFRTKGARFIGNSNAIQGYNQLPATGDLLIITKSMKDVLVLKLLGFNACALQSEQHHLEKEAYEHLSKRFKRIVLLYDNDEAGRNGATKICDKYDLTYIEIPKEEYEDSKDISDVSDNYGMQEAYQCMENLTYMWL